MALTFTNKAAREMKERIARVVGEQKAKYLWMGTFHSIFSKILRTEAEILGFDSNFTIYDTTDSRNLIKAIVKEKRLNDKFYKPAEVLGRISSAKNNLITPKTYQANTDLFNADAENNRPAVGEIYKSYFARCKNANAMDFDDLLLYTNILFRDHPEVLDKYQGRFNYLMVDEYQDTNYSQYLIVKKLAAQHNNVCVVGDDAQSIYSFRGAKIENILNFRNDYPGYNMYKLEQNYRSTQTIVDAANSIIAKNVDQIQKRVYSERDQGDLIKVHAVQTDHEEGFLVAGQIFDLRLLKQASYNDFAILYRTNAQSRIFEEALRKRNIPYKVFGSISFYQRKEIKDVLSYYRLIINNNDGEAFKRVINYPGRGIGAVTIGKIETAATQLDCSMWGVLEQLGQIDIGLNGPTTAKLKKFRDMIAGYAEMVPTTDAFELAEKVLNATKILQEFGDGKSIEERSRIENVQELINGIKTYSEEKKAANEFADLPGFMENVALLTDADDKEDPNIERVSIMTVHASKGLEFEYIFIVGMEEELFPSFMSVHSKKDLEEERRLFYVALTRAKSTAHITHAAHRMKWGKPTLGTPSRFIKEIDPQFVELPDSRFSGLSNRKPMVGSGTGLGRRNDNPARITGIKLNKPLGGTKPQAQSNVDLSNFKPDDPFKLQEGMKIIHQRFGEGEVLMVEKAGMNSKAKVFFPEQGEEKTLLLKFAKVMIVGN